jgi:hypothetical protein
MSGKITIQIGTDTFVAGPLTGIIILPNAPREVWNADAEPEAYLGVIAPVPTP